MTANPQSLAAAEPVGRSPARLVPSERLLLWAAVIGLPFAALAGIVPDAAALSVTVLGLFVLAVTADAISSLRRLEGLDADLPDVVRLMKDREGVIEVILTNRTGTGRRLRFALALPGCFASEDEQLTATLQGGAQRYRAKWACTPKQRGRYLLRHVYLETPSMLGFWGVRTARPAESELRVYPNLMRERKTTAALFLNRGGLGLHAQRQVGKGREFEKLRDYVPGDSYDEVHWKATAKRGHPVTKVFQLERTQEVYVVVDASRLSGRTVIMEPVAGGQEERVEVSQLERFITTSLVLGLAAERQGDLFGLLTFSNQVKRFIRASSGKAHYNACRDAVYTLEHEPVAPDLEELFTFIRLRLRRRALLVFLTNLDDPVLSESFLRNVELIRRQHLVLVNMITPYGVAPLFNDACVRSLSDIYDRLCGHVQWQRLHETRNALNKRGVTFSLVENEALSAELVTQYMNVKRRQLL